MVQKAFAPAANHFISSRMEAPLGVARCGTEQAAKQSENDRAPHGMLQSSPHFKHPLREQLIEQIACQCVVANDVSHLKKQVYSV